VPVGIFLVLCFLYPLYEILKRSVTERRVGLSNGLEVGVQPPPGTTWCDSSPKAFTSMCLQMASW
jgi:hypothetical protein